MQATQNVCRQHHNWNGFEAYECNQMQNSFKTTEVEWGVVKHLTRSAGTGGGARCGSVAGDDSPGAGPRPVPSLNTASKVRHQEHSFTSGRGCQRSVPAATPPAAPGWPPRPAPSATPPHGAARTRPGSPRR